MDGGAAIIGTGFMGMAHAEALARLRVPIAGVLGTSLEKSQRAAAEWNAAGTYADLEELLADPAARVVHIVTPNRYHAALASAALESGRHVMCEKPLSVTAEESAGLVRLASRRPGQAAGVCYNIRFYPLCLQARDMIRSGEIGEVLRVTGSYHQDWLLLADDYNWRVLAEEGGPLRAMADIGSHWLDLAGFLTGLEVQAVCADLQTVHPTRNRPRGEVRTFAGPDAGERQPIPIATDDAACVLLRFHAGARGCLSVSQVSAGCKNRLRIAIDGSRRSLEWNSEEPDVLWIGRRDGPTERLPKDPSLLTTAAAAASGYPGGHAEGYPDTFKNCFRAFYQDVERGPSARPDYATFADGHREILIGEAILQSHRTRAWVSLSPEIH